MVIIALYRSVAIIFVGLLFRALLLLVEGLELALGVPVTHLLQYKLAVLFLELGGDPGVVLDLLGTQALVGFDHEQLANQVLGLFAHVLPNRVLHAVLALFDFFEQFKVVLVKEGWLPG